MDNENLVSIICNTYNHEPYISDAIESFLMQKTNFKYEILIHDDASTDRTLEIIREYEKKYPDIIKPMYQVENQYSKGIQVGILNRERAIGKYYAICEGDDYWTDPQKLQKQVDFLENNLDYSLCVHSANMIDAKTKKNIKKIQPSKNNREFTIEEIIEGGGGLFATNSMVYRRNAEGSKPNFYFKNKTNFGDYQLLILLALLGKIYYMDDSMSVYRYNVPGSWTSRTMFDREKVESHNQEVKQMLDSLNEYTDYKYNGVIKKTKQKNDFNLLIYQGRIKEAKLGVFNNFYKNLSIKNKISIHLRFYFPKLYQNLFLIKERLIIGK